MDPFLRSNDRFHGLVCRTSTLTNSCFDMWLLLYTDSRCYRCLFLGSSGLWSLVPLSFSIWVLLLIPSAIRSSAFVQANLKITREGCCLIERTIAWNSFYQIMCLRSHYNDLESGQFDEEVPKKSHFARRVGLQAEVRSLCCVST